ncbi:unnamed protein product [Allacma fusca]|uniref:Integrase catalytic domain-containing protein n=1 Tax=Allacma fusca TaxID=39272 RepID=A0A8J2PE38_9HEXA|nr:unnamed protein product [Allacma fusca]
MFSDCGSNFVGADKELARDLEFLRAADNVQRVTRSLSSVGVTWHFNPPSSPHFGGLWESGVGVVKGHLKRVTGTTTLNFEELATVLAQVEACVNSRPLTPLSSDPEELSALTPGHFLIGGPLNAIPEPDLSEINISRLSRWQRCQQLAQEFWKRWHDDYLCTLQKRTKWSSTSANVKEGTLVLLKDERLPPMKWKLGRITATHPGKDELVRVVSVKTADGEFKRPIVKICPLPVDDAID